MEAWDIKAEPASPQFAQQQNRDMSSASKRGDECKTESAGENPYPCDSCTATFNTALHLKAHICSVHKNKLPFECDQCGLYFNTTGSLRIHCRKHSGERPYKCDQCSATFSQASNLTQHQVRHTWERPHTCQFCGQQFARLSLLHQHYYSHQQDDSFPCTQCSQVFQNAGLLQTHIKKEHRNHRSYRCKYCPSTFTQSCNLKRHLLTHSGLKPFACPHCKSAFTQFSHLQRHMKRLHSQLEEDKLPAYQCDFPTDFSREPEMMRNAKIHILAFMEANDRESEGQEGSNLDPRQPQQILDPQTGELRPVSQTEEATVVCKSVVEGHDSDQDTGHDFDQDTGHFSDQQGHQGSSDTQDDDHPPDTDQAAQSTSDSSSRSSSQDLFAVNTDLSFPGAAVSCDPDDPGSTGEVVFPNMFGLHRYKNNV